VKDKDESLTDVLTDIAMTWQDHKQLEEEEEQRKKKGYKLSKKSLLGK